MADIDQYIVVKKGTTSKRMPIFIKDSSVTTGAGKTGLLFNTASMVWYYWRENTGNAGGVSVTLGTATRGTWASGGFIEIDSTNLPGWYEIGIPDAVLATAANWALMGIKGAAGQAPVVIFIQLVDYDPQDTVRLGLTALPNAVPGAAGLILSGAAANQLDIDASGRVNVGKWLGTVPSALVSGQVQALSPTRSGTAQAGAASTITLDAGASATDSIYNDQMVVTLSGTGASQARLISGYVGSTKVATVTPAWQTNPDATTVFAVIPGDRANLALWVGSAVNALVSGRVDANMQAVAASLLPVKKNAALAGVTFAMFSSTDGRAEATGLTVTAQRVIDGAAIGACTNAVVEVSNGIYKIDLSAADLNGNCITFRFTATGADPTKFTVFTQG